MTKAEIVKNVSLDTGIDGEVTMLVVNKLLENIRNTVAGGEEVFFRGFGTFGVKHRAEKIGRNIGQNTPVIIPAHNIPSFKPSKEFKNQVSNK